MGAFVKFVKFVTDNYAPVEEQPNYDTKAEFIVQVETTHEDEVWYGPIPFTDLDAFVGALPEGEGIRFVAALKGGEQ